MCIWQLLGVLPASQQESWDFFLLPGALVSLPARVNKQHMGVFAPGVSVGVVLQHSLAYMLRKPCSRNELASIYRPRPFTCDMIQHFSCSLQAVYRGCETQLVHHLRHTAKQPQGRDFSSLQRLSSLTGLHVQAAEGEAGGCWGGMLAFPLRPVPHLLWLSPCFNSSSAGGRQ